MHIRNDPSFFLTNKTGAPQGEELGLIKPLSDSSFSCSDNSFISEGANRLRRPSTGAAPVPNHWELTCRVGEDPAKVFREILQESLELLVRPQVASSPTCLQPLL
ncbi:hypothetical protein Tco_1541034 [Tanacetum coccineum]